NKDRFIFSNFFRKDRLNITDNNTSIRGTYNTEVCLPNLCVSRIGWSLHKHVIRMKCHKMCDRGDEIGVVSNRSCTTNKGCCVMTDSNVENSYYVSSTGGIFNYKIFMCVCLYVVCRIWSYDGQVDQDILHNVSGRPWREGDVITILLECDVNTVTFFINEVNVGSILIQPQLTYYPALECCTKSGHCHYQILYDD
ncbi:hypothetical protein RFI_27712, partial [Reticulomyxa filosa]